MSDTQSGQNARDSPENGATMPGAGDVLVRNHDRAREHHVAVRIYGDDGQVAFETGVDLAPGATVARPAGLGAGRYTVEADYDVDRYIVTTCPLDDGGRLLVDVGNGVVDVAPGPAP